MWLFIIWTVKKKDAQLNFLIEMKCNWLQSNSMPSSPPSQVSSCRSSRTFVCLLRDWLVRGHRVPSTPHSRHTHTYPPPPFTSSEEELGLWSTLEEVVAGWGTIQPWSCLWLIHLIIRHRGLPVEAGRQHRGNILQRILSIFAHRRQFDSRIQSSENLCESEQHQRT